MWKLVIEDDEGKRTVVALARDEYGIGRKEGNAIRLTERSVSREHARILRRRAANTGVGGEKSPYIVDDLRSYNGVYVNGLRVANEQELVHGDVIQVGDYRMVMLDDKPAVDADGAVDTSIAAGHSRGTNVLEKPNRLVMLAGPTPGAEFSLEREKLTIGRSDDATIAINHNSVSRIHCEIHALGDSRFEIVDKGSANGVRVNASELRRGIIEAGDVIELGDVRFKFVGSGEIFKPGGSDNQQLAAIGDRTANAIGGRKRAKRAWPFMIFGSIVTLGAVGAILVLFFSTNVREIPSESPAPRSDATSLTAAKSQCDIGDCEAAHARIASEIPSNSELRDSPIFLDIENRWADAVLARAEAEPAQDKKRSMLYSIERAASVNSERRKVASERLRFLQEAEATTNAKELAATPPVQSPEPEPPRESSAKARTNPRALSPIKLSNAPTQASPTESDIDRVRELLLQGVAGIAEARRLLEPKLISHQATREELLALKAICKSQGDRKCVERCKEGLDE